jgi:hypothetical protein
MIYNAWTDQAFACACSRKTFHGPILLQFKIVRLSGDGINLLFFLFLTMTSDEVGIGLIVRLSGRSQYL